MIKFKYYKNNSKFQSDNQNSKIDTDDIVFVEDLHTIITHGEDFGGTHVQSNWTQTNSEAADYIKNKPSLHTVATSGSYNDLSNKPTIPNAQIQSDWNLTNTSSKDYIKNKPTLFSGSYDDLTNKPTIPSVTGLATETWVNNKFNDAFGINAEGITTLANILSDSDYTTGILTQINNKYTKPANGIPASDLADDAKYHEYVDLGLPSGTLWATMNVGATSVTDYGNYYMYGKGTTQYNSSDSIYTGTEDILDSSVDTATQTWGSSWHMPTKEQIRELEDNTTYTWTTINGVYGGKFTAANGKYVFFPAAGCKYEGGLLNLMNYYWGSSPDTSSSNGNDRGYAVSFSSNSGHRGTIGREWGLPVRPVHSAYQDISGKADKDAMSQLNLQVLSLERRIIDLETIINGPSYVITYTANAKLTETTSDKNEGLHTNAFGSATITSHTFENVTGTIVFDRNVEQFGEKAFNGCRNMTSVTIPSGVTSIGNNAFNNCSGLTSIIIPNSVTSIGSYAFSLCTNLTGITIPNSVTTIESDAFYACKGLTSIIIPNSVTNIEDYTFSSCSGLTSITIGNSVTSIGNQAFSSCSGLTSITIPNSVTSIERYAFYGCSSLASITIPNSVTNIGERTFQGCSGLTSITIPNSVTSIGSSAFKNCSSLTSVTCEPTTPPSIDTGVFDTNASGRKIYVPSASVDAYKSATNWSTYASDIEAISA